VVVNTGFGLQASIEDAYGNVVTSASKTVKLALASNPTGAKLGGTTSKATSQGVATFSGLTLNKVGSGYTLQVSCTGLTGATSTAINMTSGGMKMAVAQPTPIGGPANVGFGAAGSSQAGAAAPIVAASIAPAPLIAVPDRALVPLVLEGADFFEVMPTKKRTFAL
jgi:hypothetical protein